MRAGSQTSERRPSVELIRQWLESVADPEIPVLTIGDLGVLQDVRWEDDRLVVTITPTYSGCPAMQTIRTDIVDTLRTRGIEPVQVLERHAPAWTTDWMSDEGKRKLREYGIAPPEGRPASRAVLFGAPAQPACPRCGSRESEQLSEFGSTACKAHYRCQSCLEPFDYFKCI
jgi:ring-1,2-phenylacetyl-CoA epoxidase subunit PaaD